MIQKFLSIKAVGRFESYKAKGNTELKKANLVFAENGRGKTTLCDILRSLKSGDGAPIIGRKRLGATGQQEIIIRHALGNSKFQGTTWDTVFEKILFFDSKFVTENVYSGEAVQIDHRRNLYRLILGEEGVRLAQKVDEFTGKIRDANNEITSTKSALEKLVPAGFSVDAFRKLSPLFDIAEKIQEREKQLAELQASSARINEVRQKPRLQTIGMLQFQEFDELLKKSVGEISKDAEAKVNSHLASKTRAAPQSWVAEGLGYLNHEDCPFCGQDIRDNALVHAYSKYFSNEFGNLKRELDNEKQRISNSLGDSVIANIRETVIANRGLLEFWRQFDASAISEAATELDDDLSTAVDLATKELRFRSLELLDRKLADPLQEMSYPPELIAAKIEFENACQAIERYNKAAAAVSVVVDKIKKRAEAPNTVELTGEIANMRATEKRAGEDVVGGFRAYDAALEAKSTLDKEKEAAKADLETYAEEVFSIYEKRVNEILDSFGAGFRICDTKREYPGGKVSTRYQLLVNDHRVDLGDASSPENVPSFKNTLSTGDKGTLALAFFIAQAERDVELDSKIIVFDDPFSSHDASRRAATRQHIAKLARTAKQLIVFSHDAGFLRQLFDSLVRGQVTCLQIARFGKVSEICCWDINTATQDPYVADWWKLWNFVYDSKGEPRDVVRAIRPLLEGYLRMKLPGEFGEGQWLGEFIDRIRAASPGDVLEAAQKILPEIEAVNDYSKKFHHSTNPNADHEEINDGEAVAYCKRALALVGGF